MKKHLTDFLEDNAIRLAEKPALIFEDVTLNWQELNDYVQATAKNIAPRLSSTEQQLVSILLSNSWQYVVLYLAILRAGHIVLPLDPTFKKMEIEAICSQMMPALVLTDKDYVELFAPGTTCLLAEDIVTKELPSIQIEYLHLPADKQLATILFTSGTTGKPKAVTYTHANYVWNVEVVKELWQWSKDETLLVSLPLSHWHGIAMGINAGVYHGNTIYLHARFDAEKTLDALASGKISLFQHVPIAYSLIVNYKTDKKYDLSKVRLCVSGSSYLPPAIWHEFKALYAHEILERYGSSEMGLVTSNKLDERLPGSVGYVLPGVDVRVEPDGQLALRSGGVTPGYFGNPEATAKQITHDGYWLTGDVGKYSGKDRLNLVGRIQEKIKKQGYTIYPRDVEWSLLQHTKVKEVFVLGVQKENQLSDTIVYFVVAPGMHEDEVRDYAKQEMPASWRPDVITFLDEIPKTRSGKAKFAELKAMVKNENSSS